MIKKTLCLLAGLLINHNNTLAIDPKMAQRIGNQIWQNEASGRQDYLTFWSEHESFPSLGIGHNIWLPEGSTKEYTEGFPKLCKYLKHHGVTLPPWLEASLKDGMPWKNRTDFYSDVAGLRELRQFLVSTVSLQAEFMIDHLKQKLTEMIKATEKQQRGKIKKKINLMLMSPAGTYALVDYLNFKGDGLNHKEKSNGHSWGLLSVLQDMPDNLTRENATKAFALSAAKRLIRLIEHSEPEYKRLVFFGGWMARLNTYTKATI